LATKTRELVFRCQNQDRTAFSEFYQKYRCEVARTVYKVLGPDADLEDVVQDVFIEVFRGIDKFKGEAKITTWLYRVCINVALQRLRYRKRRPEVYTDQESEFPFTETPLRALERKKSAYAVYAILDTLAPKKRTVLLLHEILGLSAQEISNVVDVNVLTVRTRLHYARKEFYQKAAASHIFDEAEAQ
jgi:RNA polymerase sigma-70 factor (ECF subfamily)